MYNLSHLDTPQHPRPQATPPALRQALAALALLMAEYVHWQLHGCARTGTEPRPTRADLTRALDRLDALTTRAAQGE